MANYAGVGNRIVAIIIDHVIIGLITLLLAIPLGLQMFTAAATGMVDPVAYLGSMVGLWALSLVLWLAYFTYMEGSSGQTLGKRLLRIKVVKENGKPLTYVDAFVRTLLRIVDGMFAYLIGFIVIVATDKKQRVGDMAAGTIVVNA